MKFDSPLDGKIIAVLDDHKSLLKALGGYLESFGAKVLSFDDGQEFLREIPNIHCLVSDYLLPGLNGVELACALRKRGYGIPIIILTALGDEITIDDIARAEITEVLDKWSAADTLVDVIQQATYGTS